MDTGAIIALVLTVLIIGGAVAYIVKAKMSGKRCIGCPDGGSCSSHGCSGNCGGCQCGCAGDSKNDSDPSDADNNE